MTKCKNFDECGTAELEAPSSLILGVCLKCRGYYKPGLTFEEKDKIWFEATKDITKEKME